MNTDQIPNMAAWIGIISWLLPLVMGLLVRWVAHEANERDSHRWRWTIVTSGLTILTNLFLVWEISYMGSGTRVGRFLFRDIVSENIAFFYSIVVFLLVWIMPKTDRLPRTLSGVLVSESLALLFFRAENPILFGSVWAARVFVFYPSNGRPRGHLLFQSTSIVLVTAGLVLLKAYFPSLGTSRLPELLVGAPEGRWVLVVAVLFFVGGSIRQGLFPFHVGLRALAHKAPFPILFTMVTSNMGLYLLLRYFLPLVGAGNGTLAAKFAIWVVSSLAYLSLTIVTPDNIRELFATLLSMQSSLIVIGMLQFDAVGSAGATIQWIVALMAAGGFGLCIWILQVRSGVKNARQSHVTFDKMPRVAILFLGFGMGVVDFPGTLGFIGEDLLVHSVLRDSLLQGFLVLAAMSAGSIAVYRSYVDLFLGRPMDPGEVKTDLISREAAAFGVLLLLLVGLGVYPTPVTGGMGVFATAPTGSNQVVSTKPEMTHYSEPPRTDRKIQR